MKWPWQHKKPVVKAPVDDLISDFAKRAARTNARLETAWAKHLAEGLSEIADSLEDKPDE